MANPIKYTLATNLNTYSEDFTQGTYASISVTKTANYVVTPFGNTNSSLISRISATANSYISKFILFENTTTPRLRTLSIYAKLGTVSTNFGLRCQSIYPDRGDVLFNLSTGTLIGAQNGGTNTLTSGTITSVGNGWYRCTVTTTFPGTASNIYLVCSPTALTSLSGWEASDGALSNCYIYGAQLEKGSVATTYIATTASSVTVNATQSNSIKTSNFAIGVNKGGYGPTNITNFYNGKTANVGGYTVYVSNGSGSPSPFVASNDAALITLSNQLGGSGIATISAALNFFNASSTMLCTNMDYPNIVTSGLVLNLDAAYTPSYPKGLTAWTDLSGYGNNGILVNGPSYSSTGGGSIGFDGIDDNISTNLILPSPSSKPTTFEVIFNANITVPGSTFLIGRSSYQINGFSVTYGVGTIKFIYNGVGVKSEPIFTYDILNISIGTFIFDGRVLSCYRNGVFVGSSTATFDAVASPNPIYVAKDYQGGNIYPNCNIYSVKVYNRVLTQSEILQNYYAGLQRFIPTDSLILSLDAQNPNRRISNPTIAYDVSGNGYDGAMMNGLTFSTDGQTSFSFDGVNDYIDIGTKALLLPQSLSINLWFKISSYPSSSQFIIRSRTYGWGISITGNSISSMLYTSASNQIVSNNVNISLNVYNHVAITYTASTFCMYLNGVQVYTTTSPTNSIYYVNGYVAIGRDADSAGSYFTGNISTLQIHSRALTTTEVSTIYTATKSRYGL